MFWRIGIGGILFLLGIFLLFHFEGSKETQKNNFQSSETINYAPPPESVGPYAYQISFRFYTPNFRLQLSAKEMFLVPAHVLFFRFKLLKRLVLTQVHLTVFRNKEKLLELRKGKLVLDPHFQKIVIERPEIIYIKGNIIPQKVVIIPEQGEVRVWAGLHRVNL